jgi:hypothetical protein
MRLLYLGGQTDRPGFVASNGAVLDRDMHGRKIMDTVERVGWRWISKTVLTSLRQGG